jgi:capsular polysaccharide biosynthesis protein
MIRRLGKTIAGSIAVLALLLIVVANFSVLVSRYQCSGTITKEPYQSTETIFVKLEKYRWWVGLWSDSYGNMHVEIPHQSIEYYSSIVEAGDILQVFSVANKLEGQFSALSRSLTLKTSRGLFEGTCRPIPNG